MGAKEVINEALGNIEDAIETYVKTIESLEDRIEVLEESNASYILEIDSLKSDIEDLLRDD